MPNTACRSLAIDRIETARLCSRMQPWLCTQERRACPTRRPCSPRRGSPCSPLAR
jgi:hypothetical protein